MRYGLTEQTIQKINSVFEKYPVVKQAVLYGSRAKGNYKPGSDIDLSLFGEDISRREVHQILDELDALDLPYTMDLTVFRDITHAKFRDHIARVGVVFYQRDDESQSVQSVEGAGLDCCADTEKDEVFGFYQRDVVPSALSKNFNMPSNCEQVMLGEVCKLINGRAYSQSELLSEGRYPVLRVGNFFSNRKWYYSDLELAGDKYCNYGDLLYAWSASFGSKIWDGGKTIFHYHIWKVKINETRIDKFFLNYWFEWDKETIKKETGAGTTMIHVTKKSMEERRLSLPPLQEQKRIVAILNNVFERIDVAIANTEKNIANSRELFESYLNHLVVEDNRRWPKKKLRDLCHRITVGHVGTMASQYKETGIPFLRSQNVKPFAIDLDGVKFIDDYFHASLQKSSLSPGDVAIVRTGYPGTAAVIPEEIEVANCSDLVIAKPKNALSPHYLALFFNSFYGKKVVGLNLVGAAQKHFNITAAKDVDMHMPPVAEQSRTVEKVMIFKTETESLVASFQQKHHVLAELKQSLLQKAFSGELPTDFNPDALEH